MQERRKPSRVPSFCMDLSSVSHEDGSYWCGMNFEGERFEAPGQYFTADQPTWNSAAVVLAAHVLAGDSPTAQLFTVRTA